MKSALEIAMERANKMSGGEEGTKLTDEQKKEIASLRKEYEGKVAEREIMFASEQGKFSGAGLTPEAYDLMTRKKEVFLEEKKSLQKEMEQKIAAVREG